MEKDYYIGFADKKDYKELMRLLDQTFFNDENDKGDFITLLPKLYKKKYDPCTKNVILRKDGKILAAVGLYYSELAVGNKILYCGGIGNVAVDKSCRGAGYMKDTMLFALEDMKKNGADFSFLGGRRQRYMYFSYDIGGISFGLSINDTSMRHTMGTDYKTPLTAKKVTRSDAAALDAIYELHNSIDVHIKRGRDELYDILLSWKTVVYAAYEGEKFAGYYVANRKGNFIPELYAADKKYIEDIAALALQKAPKDYENKHSIYVIVPEYETEYLKRLSRISEGFSPSNASHISILNYKNILSAFLSLKADYRGLADGNLVLLIHGETGDEKLEISVKNNKVSVENTNKPHDIELEHLEAVRLIANHYSERRNEIFAECAQWFPIPLFISSIDTV